MMLADIQSALPSLEKTLNHLSQLLKIPDGELRIAELESLTNTPEFWNDSLKAKAVMRELSALKESIHQHHTTAQKLDDLKVLMELAQSDATPEFLEEIQREFQSLQKEIGICEMALLLNGQYDTHACIFSIAAGAGGTDAQDWAQMLMRMYTRHFERKRYKFHCVDLSSGEEAGIKGATFMVEGDHAFGYLKAESGVHRLVRISPFNANDKRQTSFAAVEVIPEVDMDLSVDIGPDDLRVDTFRASGAGGQHVNRTDSAVRITHLPTGLVVQCQNERSQIQNKETAMKILSARLALRLEAEHKEKISELRGDSKDIAWGHQIRSYVLHPYSLVKDHRTEVETGNVQSVLDGELDLFIEAYLKRGIA